MRPLYVVHLAAPAPERERSASEADAATAVIILFCALICGLALKAATRCFILLGGGCLDDLPQSDGDSKPDQEEEAAGRMVVAYTAGMGLAECAICLSEFEEGEGVQVLTRCNHGFHVDCIAKWLCSHSSCPTCRCSCLADVDPVVGGDHQRS